jgi:hypothetical protein
MNGYDTIALFIVAETVIRLATLSFRHRAAQRAAERKTAERTTGGTS